MGYTRSESIIIALKMGTLTISPKLYRRLSVVLEQQASAVPRHRFDP